MQWSKQQMKNHDECVSEEEYAKVASFHQYCSTRFTLSVIGVGMRRSRGEVPLHPRYNAVMGVAAHTAL